MTVIFLQQGTRQAIDAACSGACRLAGCMARTGRTCLAWLTLPAARVWIRHQEREWWREQHWRRSKVTGADIPEQVWFRDTLHRAASVAFQSTATIGVTALLPMLATPVQASVVVGAAAGALPIVLAVRGRRMFAAAADLLEHDTPVKPLRVPDGDSEFATRDEPRLRLLLNLPPQVLDRLLAEIEPPGFAR